VAPPGQATEDALPPPPLPPGVVLRSFPWFPLDVVRLRDSRLAFDVTPEAFRSAVLLWCVSWHQDPAASLPDDDRQLAAWAGYGAPLGGRVSTDWVRVRGEGALHGFVACADGRLYHPVLVEKALTAWGQVVDRNAKREADRARKAGGRRPHAALARPPPGPNGTPPEPPTGRRRGPHETPEGLLEMRRLAALWAAQLPPPVDAEAF